MRFILPPGLTRFIDSNGVIYTPDNNGIIVVTSAQGIMDAQRQLGVNDASLEEVAGLNNSAVGYLFNGALTAGIAATSAAITWPQSGVVTVTAGAGVTGLVALVQVATDAALSNWVNAGVVNLSAPGTANVRIALPYYATRVNVVSVTGGLASAQLAADAAQDSGAVGNPSITGMPGLASYALARGRIPIINPGSGSIGNNGALTLTTALPGVFSDCYMAFPANVIAAGVPTGVYYVQMFSATQGTIFNNRINSQILLPQLTVPASPTPFVTTGPGAYTAYTAADMYALSIPIYPGVLGVNSQLRVRALYGCVGTSMSAGQNIGATAAEGTNASSSTAIKAVPYVGALNGGFDYRIYMQGALNKQIISAAAAPAEAVLNSGAVQLTTFDFSTLQYLIFRIYLGTAAAYHILYDYAIEIIP